MRTIKVNYIIEKMLLAVAGELPWSFVLADLCVIMQADMSLMTCWNTETFLPEWSINYNLPDSIAIGYQGYYSALDPLLPIGVRSPELKWLATNKVVSNKFVERSEYFQDFLIPSGILYVAGCNLYKSDSACVSITFEREKARDPFNEEDFAKMGVVVKNLSLAIKAYCKTLNSQAERDILHSYLDLRGRAFYVMDKNRKIRHISCGDDFDQTFNGNVKIKDGFLFMATVQQNYSLDKAIEVAMTCGLETSFSSLGVMGSKLNVNVSVLNSNGFQSCLLISFSNDCNKEIQNKDRVNDFFSKQKLSVAERKVALAIVDGLTVRDYCVQTSLSAATVRTQLKNIFRKTGCSRQADLIRLANQ
ncbi:helix-turn-helix transcriptional regulator [Vogesella sp. GCM10023246]|uniref:Helix-turn-helix transcriptional regulator n=1 Tax=Vogesella oryzagri TaxID=3160864 RepID=A0ABV1M352_9NEIS